MAYKEPVKGTLLSYRNDIKVLDATVRDGGLVNNFFFTDQFVRDLYETNLKAGVDYMELGYLADKELFDPEKFGKWKFFPIRRTAFWTWFGLQLTSIPFRLPLKWWRNVLPRAMKQR